MMPVAVRNIFPRWLTALLLMLCILLVVSTDDTRIFDISMSWTQDFILPFFRKAPSPRLHLAICAKAFRFVALDTNVHHGPDGRLKHYADESVRAKCHQEEMVLPPDQEAFLVDAVATAPGPVCVFSHARFRL